MSNFNPYLKMPYGASMPQYPQRTMWPQPSAQGAPRQLVRVSGMDGARAYQMAPNDVVALFDEVANIALTAIVRVMCCGNSRLSVVVGGTTAPTISNLAIGVVRL